MKAASEGRTLTRLDVIWDATRVLVVLVVAGFATNVALAGQDASDASVLVAATDRATPRSADSQLEPSDDKSIVTGTIVEVDALEISVRDGFGVIHRLPLDETTLILSDEEDFSMATLPEIELSLDELIRGDVVEIVVEPKRDQDVAGIVTRLSLFSGTETARGPQPRQ